MCFFFMDPPPPGTSPFLVIILRIPVSFWFKVLDRGLSQQFSPILCGVGETISGNVYNPFRFSNVSYFSCKQKDHLHRSIWRHGDLMVSALDSGLSSLGSNHTWEHCVVFLSKTLYSHSACLHPGVYKWVIEGLSLTLSGLTPNSKNETFAVCLELFEQ